MKFRTPGVPEGIPVKSFFFLLLFLDKFGAAESISAIWVTDCVSGGRENSWKNGNETATSRLDGE